MKKIIILLTLLLIPQVVSATACINDGEFVVNHTTKQCAYFDKTTSCQKGKLPNGWEKMNPTNTNNYNDYLSSQTEENWRNKCKELGYAYLNKDVAIKYHNYLETLVYVILAISVFGYFIFQVLLIILKGKIVKLQKSQQDTMVLTKKYKKIKIALVVDLSIFLVILIWRAIDTFLIQ